MFHNIENEKLTCSDKSSWYLALGVGCSLTLPELSVIRFINSSKIAFWLCWEHGAIHLHTFNLTI